MVPRSLSRRSTRPCRAPLATASYTSIRSNWPSRCTNPRTSHPVAPIGEVERQIGVHVAELVPDGATLHLGIGAIPAAVGEALRGKRNLGIHTELLTETILPRLISLAALVTAPDSTRSTTVSAFVLGTQRVYRYIDDSPMVEMRPVDYTNDTAVIRRFRRMVAINSAIEVDLSGQVVADSIGRRLYSGVGGQMDFIRGAALAEEGRAIIVLPSTAAGGSASRIVASLREGAGVVTSRGSDRRGNRGWAFAGSRRASQLAARAPRQSLVPSHPPRNACPAAVPHLAARPVLHRARRTAREPGYELATRAVPRSRRASSPTTSRVRWPMGGARR